MTDRESYIRQETVTGVVPMLKGDRQYSFLDLFLSTSGFAIATWCYTQGAYVAQYLSFSRMLINAFSFYGRRTGKAAGELIDRIRVNQIDQSNPEVRVLNLKK